MAQKELDARDRIIRAAAQLLEEVPDIEKITVRQIAQLAGVGIGLINYHFSSKNNLLSLAIGGIMADIIKQHSPSQTTDDLSPAERLKAMLKELCNIATANGKLMHFVLTQSLLNGDTDTPLYLIPALKEIFGSEKDELELRIIALQILHPLQAAALSPVSFRLYSGISLEDPASRGRFIDMLIDNLIHKEKE